MGIMLEARMIDLSTLELCQMHCQPRSAAAHYFELHHIVIYYMRKSQWVDFNSGILVP